jgi:hypothetical protein
MPIADSVPTNIPLAGILSLSIPLACLVIVLAWWGWLASRRGA